MSFSEHARPFLTFHVGQAGVQIGHAIWELLCLEHNIDPDGNAKPECKENGMYDSMFLRSASGHFMPRSILVDTDPTCIDEVRVGPYRQLFSATQLLSDHCDTGNNYMRGRHDFKNHLVPETIERFRGLLEKTETTPGIFLIHSVGGGTGSGLAVSCLKSLQGEFGSSLQVIEMNVSSGRTGLQNSCEIINQLLYLYESRDFTNLSFTVTNSAMYNVCRSGLNMTNATYAHLNRILAMCFSNITAMERFPGTMPCTVESICSNVRPFKHMKNLVLACAPFITNDLLSKERLNTIGLTSSVLEADSQMADVDLRRGRHMAGVLLFRGAVKPTDIEQAVNAIRSKGKIEFVDWAPPSFKTGLIELPPLAAPSSGIGAIPLSVTLISNHTSIASLFRSQTEAIKKLSQGGYFLQNYEAVMGGGVIGSSHNSGIANLLQEACDHMDSIVKVYESEQPPDFEPKQDSTKLMSSQVNLGSVTLSDIKKTQTSSGIRDGAFQTKADRLRATQDLQAEMRKDDASLTILKSQSMLEKDKDGAPLQIPNRSSLGGMPDDSSRTNFDQELALSRSTRTTSEATPDLAKSYGAQKGSGSGRGGGSGGGSSGGGGGGCCKRSCKKRENTQQPSASKGAKKRSKSQNQANSELHDGFENTSTESEGFRSAHCSDFECFRNRPRAKSAESSFRNYVDKFSSVSTRSTDSVTEVSDIIEGCEPCKPQQACRNTNTVRQIIQKYNQMFTQSPSVVSPATMTTENVLRAFK